MTALDASEPADFKRPVARDYSLSGASAQAAEEAGLVAAEWYHTEVPRKVMKDLMKRSDGVAIRDTILWIALHIGFAAAAVALSLTGHIWLSVPFWLAYGVLYGSASDSRWHECGHGTAFRTTWMNNWVYQIASFQVMRNPVNWRWSHARHHTDTIIVGRDVEISWMHPVHLTRKALGIFGIFVFWDSIKVLVRNALGNLSDDERNYIPQSERGKAVFAARVHVAIYAATLLAALALLVGGAGWAALIPPMLIGLPRLYGCWHMVMTGLLQHGGLAEDVLDHRLNSRTVLMNPVSRWLYWNMNYHVEHHMFPMVPYHALPRLHEVVKHDLPEPDPSIWVAWRRMMAAILRQRREPGYYQPRVLPPTARPYREDLHLAIPERLRT